MRILEYRDYKDITDRIDSILDKISKNGIESLSKEERALLDAHKEGGETSIKAFKNLSEKDMEKTFINDDKTIKFYLKRVENTGKFSNEMRIFGTMEFIKSPNNILHDINNKMKGYIQVYEGDIYTSHFDYKGYTDFDFVLEDEIYEYDNFLGEIVDFVIENHS